MKRLNKFKLKLSNQGRNLSTILVVVSVFGVISYLLLAFTAPFKDNIFNVLFQKPFSNAQIVSPGMGITAISTPPPIQVVNPVGTVDLTINPSTNTTTLGQNLNLTLDANTNSSTLDGAELHITFDPTKLQVQTITPGTFLGTVLTPGSFDNSAGTASITLGSGTTSARGSGTLTTITFKVISTGSSIVNYKSTTFTATNGQNSLHTLTGAAIDTPTPTAAPSIVPTTSPSPQPTVSPTITPTSTPIPTSIPTLVTLNMSPATQTTTVNQTFDEALNVNTNGELIQGANLHITFDPTKLQVQTITPGTFLGTVLTPGSFDNSAGTASISLGSGISSVNGTGTLATINFKAISTGSIPITYASTTQTATNGQNSLSNTSGANITVNPPFTPIPTASPTATPTAIPTTTPTLAPTPSSSPTPTTLTPQLVINFPTNGNNITGSTVNVSYSIINNTAGSRVAMVHLTLDNNPTQMDMSLSGSFTFNSIPAGNHTLTAFLAKSDHTPVGNTVTVNFTTTAPSPTCVLGPAMWNTASNPIRIGSTVGLQVFGTGTCGGKTIHFQVSTDSLFGSILATNQPLDVVMNGNVASGSWVTERQTSFGGLLGDPAYQFTAQIVGDNASPIISNLPDLTVTSSAPTFTPTPYPTITPAPGGINLSIDPSSLNTRVGQNITISLNLNTGNSSVDGAELHLTFDPTKLQVQSFDKASFLSALLTPGKFDNRAGTASIILGAGTSTAHGSGTIATMTLQSIALGTTQINYDPATYTATNGQVSPSITAGTNITINNNTNNLPPPPAPQPPGPPGPPPPPTANCAKASLGDLNCDNKIDIFDLSILLRNWGKSGTGDLNHSGKVDIFDLSILLRNWGK